MGMVGWVVAAVAAVYVAVGGVLVAAAVGRRAAVGCDWRADARAMGWVVFVGLVLLVVVGWPGIAWNVLRGKRL